MRILQLTNLPAISLRSGVCTPMRPHHVLRTRRERLPEAVRVRGREEGVRDPRGEAAPKAVNLHGIV